MISWEIRQIFDSHPFLITIAAEQADLFENGTYILSFPQTVVRLCSTIENCLRSAQVVRAGFCTALYRAICNLITCTMSMANSPYAPVSMGRRPVVQAVPALTLDTPWFPRPPRQWVRSGTSRPDSTPAVMVKAAFTTARLVCLFDATFTSWAPLPAPCPPMQPLFSSQGRSCLACTSSAARGNRSATCSPCTWAVSPGWSGISSSPP